MNAIAHEPQREREVRVDALGERLAALRLCDADALTTMQRSLSQHGQLAAATVYVAERGELEVIDGFKRLRAARALGWSTLRVHELGVDGVGAKVAIDTLHHGGGLTELEEAWLVRALYREDKLGQPAIARHLGRHKSWVCRRLMLAEGLEESLQADVRLGLLSPSAAATLAQLQRCNQVAAAQVVTRHGLTCRQTTQLVTELRALGSEAERARVLKERLAHPQPGPRAAPKPAQRARTAVEWLMADIATLTRVAARLQARLCEQPLSAWGPRTAALAADALMTLVPVLGTLEKTITTVAEKDAHASLEHPRGAEAQGHHAAPAGPARARDRASAGDQPQHGA